MIECKRNWFERKVESSRNCLILFAASATPVLNAGQFASLMTKRRLLALNLLVARDFSLCFDVRINNRSLRYQLHSTITNVWLKTFIIIEATRNFFLSLSLFLSLIHFSRASTLSFSLSLSRSLPRRGTKNAKLQKRGAAVFISFFFYFHHLSAYLLFSSFLFIIFFNLFVSFNRFVDQWSVLREDRIVHLSLLASHNRLRNY